MTEYEHQMTVVISNSHFGRRLFSLATSVIIHFCLVIVLSLISLSPPLIIETHVIEPDYSVRFLNLQTPLVYRGGSPGSMAAMAGLNGASSAPAQERNRLGQAGLRTSVASTVSRQPSTSGETAAPSVPAAKREYRQFQLPPINRPQEAKQTLVQLEVPPEIQLKREIPLPTVVLWTQTKLSPPPRKQFVAPAKNQPLAMRSLPEAIAIEPPNAEIAISDVNISASILNRTARFFHPPSVAPPVVSHAEAPAVEIPQIGLANSNQSIPANILSLPNTPARSVAVIGIPPANQIARQDVAEAASAGDTGAARSSQGSGSTTGRDTGGSGSQSDSSEAGGRGPGEPLRDSGTGGSGTSVIAGGIAGAGTGGRSNDHDGPGESIAAKNPLARGSNNGTGAHIASHSSSGTGAAAVTGFGAGGTNTGLDGGLNTRLPGVSRVDLPKDGNFGVVVLGSADATRYPESIGALSGKILYTVYIRVGLRKNWIMQYCLAEEPHGGTPHKGATPPLEAPWPYLIERPDRWSASDPDYIMVHGLITTAGRFDQLALVYPSDLEKKDLLLDSLKLWDFRPASRDGEPAAVEVLLIIPREAE